MDNLVIMNSETGEVVAKKHVPEHITAFHYDSLRSMLFVATLDYSIYCWSVSNIRFVVWEVFKGRLSRFNKQLCEILRLGHAQRVNSLATFDNLDALASSSNDGTIRVWSLETGTCFVDDTAVI